MSNISLDTENFLNEPGSPAPVKFSHVSMPSVNYDKMVDFYRTLLNMRVVYEIKGRIHFCMLSFDDENHRIGIANLPHLLPKEMGRAGIDHVSFSYSSMQSMFAAIKLFKTKTGNWPLSAVHQGPIIAVSYRDPDGNRCEITADCYATQAEVIQYFHDTYHDPDFNTLLSFDIVKMIALADSGMPVDELTRYETVQRLLAEGQL